MPPLEFEGIKIKTIVKRKEGRKVGRKESRKEGRNKLINIKKRQFIIVKGKQKK